MTKTFHPLTWWVGAVALAIAVLLTENTIFNLLIVGGVSFLFTV
jgi:hypothetical protein